MEPDNHLLLGILAYQNGFVSRDQLLAAVDQWLQEKQQSLDQILLRNKALREEEARLLRDLMQQLLSKQGGTQSLYCTIGPDTNTLLDELRRRNDADIYSTIGYEPSDTTLERPRPTGGAARFKILRPHDEGGLGKVSVALDTELDREVALKEIKPRYADDQTSRARFMLEAEITGGLEHPGIVPIYGLGSAADGRPYYAMRFIKGDNLATAIKAFHENIDRAQDAVGIRRLLGRFLDVCNAVYYAHQRGVLHRDLKPGNVMLGEYGETLVVDWGLAKPLSRAEPTSSPSESTASRETPLTPRSGSVIEETQQGFAIGTPHYMSPEQARGEHDRLGPAADVYSLGATLFTLLTNRKPVEGETLEEILERVQFGKRKTARELNPGIDQALSAICERAMAVEAEDRYRSVRQLANDVERFLADEAVEAYPEPLSRRTQRWVRKHPRIVGSLAATLVAGVVSAALITSIIASSNRVLGKKNVELAELNVHLEASREQAVQERDRAVTAEHEARRKTRIANSTLDFLSKDLFLQLSAHEALQEWKSNPTVSEPGDDALDEDFTLDLPEDAFETEQKEFAYEYADDLFLLSPALISQSFQEDPTVKRLSNMTLTEALDHAAKRITVRFANDPEVESKAHKIIGGAYASLNDLPKAIPELEKALTSYREHLGNRHPDTLATMAKLGILQRSVGEKAKSEELLQKAVTGQSEVHGPAHYQTLSSKLYLANVYLDLGKLDMAEKVLFDSWKVLQQWDIPFERSMLTFSLFRRPYPSTIVPKVELDKGVAPNEMQEIVILALAQSMHRYFTERRKSEEFTLAARVAENPLLELGMNQGVMFDKARNSFQRQLAYIYLRLERFEAAESQLRKVQHDIEINELPDVNLDQPFPELAWKLRDVHEKLGYCRLQQKKFADAELSLRSSLNSHQRVEPASWSAFRVKSLLGAALLGQQEFATAETQLIAGYEGLVAQEKEIPEDESSVIRNALERLVNLYEAWDQPEKAAMWREKLSAMTVN